MFDKLFELIQWIGEALVPFVIILPYQEAVRIRLGKFQATLAPGIHWRIPIADSVLHENVVARTTHITGLSTTTSDGKAIGFDAVVTYRISDIKKALLEVEDVKDAVADTCAGQMGTTLADSSWDDVWHGKAVDNLTSVCRKRGWKWGIEILSVQLSGVCLVKNIRISTGGGAQAPHSQFSVHI